MADFEKAFEEVVLKQQGASAHVEPVADDENICLLCSDCFTDEGLKLDVYAVGTANSDKCPNCGSTTGQKLNRAQINRLCFRFFVTGTIHKCEYGGSPQIQFNEYHFNQPGIRFSTWLENDVRLIEQAAKIGLFYYGPRLWMVGDVEPLIALQNDAERDAIVEKILQTYPSREVTNAHYFYRLRVDPEKPHQPSEYDTAPKGFLGRNRFDEPGFPVLYGSPDLELCLHECRVTVENQLYVAKLVPMRTLKLLDLSALVYEPNVTEFESLDIAVHFMFLAGKHSYPACRRIAQMAKEKGFDGLIYPSYFSYMRTGAIPFVNTVYGLSHRIIPQLQEYAQSETIPNVAIFGRPIQEKVLSVDCINKVIISQVRYQTSFGPAYHAPIDEHIDR